MVIKKVVFSSCSLIFHRQSITKSQSMSKPVIFPSWLVQHAPILLVILTGCHYMLTILMQASVMSE